MAIVPKIPLLPNIAKLSKFQREEYAKIWFDLAKLAVGSLVIKIFEPGNNLKLADSLITVFIGLMSFLMCVNIGLYISKEEL